MTNKTLYDLQPKDTVAYKNYFSDYWYKTVVLQTTDRCIIVECEPEQKFKKSNGTGTTEDNRRDKISIVTPEIQEQWDKAFYKDYFQSCLLETENSASTDEILAEVFDLLVSQTKWEQREHRTAIYDILLKLKHLSSDSLKQAVAILEGATQPNN